MVLRSRLAEVPVDMEGSKTQVWAAGTIRPERVVDTEISKLVETFPDGKVVLSKMVLKVKIPMIPTQLPVAMAGKMAELVAWAASKILTIPTQPLVDMTDKMAAWEVSRVVWEAKKVE